MENHEGRNYPPFSVFKSLGDIILSAAGRALLAWVNTSGSMPEKLHSSSVTALNTTWLGITQHPAHGVNKLVTVANGITNLIWSHWTESLQPSVPRRSWPCLGISWYGQTPLLLTLSCDW